MPATKMRRRIPGLVAEPTQIDDLLQQQPLLRLKRAALENALCRMPTIRATRQGYGSMSLAEKRTVGTSSSAGSRLRTTTSTSVEAGAAIRDGKDDRETPEENADRGHGDENHERVRPTCAGLEVVESRPAPRAVGLGVKRAAAAAIDDEPVDEKQEDRADDGRDPG